MSGLRIQQFPALRVGLAPPCHGHPGLLKPQPDTFNAREQAAHGHAHGRCLGLSEGTGFSADAALRRGTWDS